MKKIFLYTILIFLAFYTMALSYNLEGLSITGSVSQGFLKTTEYNYLVSDSKEGSYKFGEGLVNISVKPYDELRVGMSIAYRRLGVIGNNEPYINWVMGDYSFKEWLSFRVGIIKTPLGFYNDTRDMDLFRTSIILPLGIYQETYRDYFNNLHGASIYGSVFAGALGLFKYQAIVGTSKIDTDSGVVRLVKDAVRYVDIEFTSIEEENGQFNIDLTWVPRVNWMMFKYNYHSSGDSKLNSVISENFEASVFIKNYRTQTCGARLFNESLTFEGEYINIRLQSLTLVPSMPALNTKAHVEISGWYVNLKYRFLDWLEAGIYYTTIVNPASDFSPTKMRIKDTCVSVRFDIVENVIFKIEGHFLQDVNDGVLVADNPDADLTNPEDNWTMFASKITLSF